MISPFDDYCLHQTPDYLRVPGTTDRNFYDRYFFSGYRPAGDLVFGLSFGRYPNRFVQDAHFTVMLGGVQYALHASDVLGRDPSRNVVGPIEVAVVEPMRVLRCKVDAPEQGIACDLLFRAETGAIDEGRLLVMTATSDRPLTRVLSDEQVRGGDGLYPTFAVTSRPLLR